MWWLYLVAVALSWCVDIATAQESGTCYGGGSIATAVILTIIILLVLGGAVYYGWKRYGKYKKGKHLILETDPEKGAEYAFDNPGFKEPGLSPIGKVVEKTVETSNKPKWTSWAPLSVLTSKAEKRKTVDDSALSENEVKVVSLRSHDFTGLGFNICGNMRDGIFIKDILQHGPASESGRLSAGDRITSVTINFEHMVYEDALTILSYASPYEVVIQATNSKLTTTTSTQQCARPAHPLYKSASSADLIQIGRSAKKRLFQAEELNDSFGSNYSSLQKSRSNATTLERSQSDSPVQKIPHKKPNKNALNADQLKTQLEQTILEDHKENLRNKHNLDKSLKIESETQKTDNSYQKFGVKVFPSESREQKSPKIAELSQNDNNINIERNDSREVFQSIDEVDKKAAPPIKKREKKPEIEDTEPEPFQRGGSLSGSGIKRDENGIPQEIPNHMMNAAVAARRNRKPSQENLDEKTPKKQKGKAPAPPENLKDSDDKPRQNFDEIYTAENELPPRKTPEIIEEDIPISIIKNDVKTYESDSDQETDNQSSVNTIELNSSDITIHQTEEGEDKQNRKTASTGDLTKIQRIKNNSGTLERAQSLDITDTGMPVLGKKRKAGHFEENFDSKDSSNDSIYGNALINKEPRLSLILDGLNTFQRSRLKKSTEWGNLEDAILNLNKSDSSENCETGERMFDNESNDSSFDLTSRATPELDALVNKIKEIKEETTRHVEEQEKEMRQSWNETSETLAKAIESFKEKPIIDDVKSEILEKTEDNVDRTKKNDNENLKDNDSSFVADVLNAVSNLQFQEEIINPPPNVIENKPKPPKVRETKTPNVANASMDLLKAEREHSNKEYFHNTLEDTNISDDIKVSRHSLSSDRSKFNEIPIKPHLKENVSNITISDKYSERKPQFELYEPSTSVKEKPYNTDDKILVSTPDLIKNVSIAEAIHDLNEVTIEGPTSLTFEIKSPELREPKINNTTNIPLGLDCEDIHFSSLSNGSIKGDLQDHSKQNSSLTYITEIQVVTPNNNKNVSEIEIVQKPKNLDNEFENFVKNFEAKSLDTMSISTESIPEVRSPIPFEKIDAEKELHKIQEIAEEQLKKLPEMRFTTSSYEPSKIPEKRQSQIELLRSNFERSPPKTKPEAPIKSRIPIATMKTPPTSPERRDSKNEFEMDKEIIEIMTSGKYQPKITPKNVTVTSIRSSKIPSGLPTYSSRPPVPPRKTENSEGSSVIQLSSNGNTETSFKQWVFNPSENSITNITVSENQTEK